MLRCIILIALFFSTLGEVYAASGDVRVRVDPLTPIVGEPFSLIFTIETRKSGDPYITFDSGGIHVEGKENLGVSVSTTLINGRFSRKKIIRVGYQMIAEKAGHYSIRDINVNLDGENIKVNRVKFKVLKTAPRARDIFVHAEVSDNSIFLGEGIDVNYYLYFLVPVAATEIKAFPKLKRFLKRFHMVKERIERAEFDGRVYRRILKYSARLFPEKIGILKIDPLKLVVQYGGGSGRNSPFSNFGFQFRNYKTRSFQSREVKINVKALPSENVPTNFTGLVGKHSMTLSLPRQKFVVNEPIELTLEVQGSGALENMEAPNIYDHLALEEFDTKSELLELNQKNSRKVFDYTFLARESLVINEVNKDMYYFDPLDEQYKKMTVNIPKITVAGAAILNNSTLIGNRENIEKESSTFKKEINKKKTGLVGPIFTGGEIFQSKNIINIINATLLIILTWVLKGIFFFPSLGADRESDLIKLISNMRKKGITYSGLSDILDKLRLEKNETLSLAIERSQLSGSAKNYFSSLLELIEKNNFTKEVIENNEDMKFKNKYFKEVVRVVRNGG